MRPAEAATLLARQAPTIIRPMVAADVLAIELQPMQAMDHYAANLAHGERAIAAGVAWTAMRGGVIIGCGGLCEIFPQTAVAWAMLSASIGAGMVAITRQARRAIAQSRWSRIEAIVRADWPEALEWATLLGLKQSAVLRHWGPMASDHVLFEHISDHVLFEAMK